MEIPTLLKLRFVVRCAWLGVALLAACSAGDGEVDSAKSARNSDESPGPDAQAAAITIDAAHPIGETNPNLIGFGEVGFDMHSASALEKLAPLEPRTMRIGGNISEMFGCPEGFPNGKLMPGPLESLQKTIDGAEVLGAETILILTYMPKCLAATFPGDPRDPGRLPPRDPAAYEALMTELVTALGPGRVARGHRPVRYFEAWNEPDLQPIAWAGTLADFITGIELPVGRAVKKVAAESGLDLRFGICGCFAADPAWVVPLLMAARAASIPVGFISWHYYTALGPDGAAGTPDQLQVLAPFQKHRANTPDAISAEIALMRAAAAPDTPELIIDEWAISAGGFDLRNDTHEGAAFEAGVLTQMAEGGLDRATVYNSVDPVGETASDGSPLPARYGGWGVLDKALERKPTWYTHWLWNRLGPERLGSPQDPVNGIWTAAARNQGAVQVLVASYLPSDAVDHALTLQVTGLAAGAKYKVALYRIDAKREGSTEPAWTTKLRADADGVAVLKTALLKQSVLFVEFVPAS